MEQGVREKRRFARVYFSKEEKVNGLFIFPDLGQLSFAASVLDLSLGGLHFSLKREERSAIETGSSLLLSELRQDGLLLCDKAIPISVRWVLDHPAVSNVSIGCEFLNFPGESRKRLESFISERLAACHP